MIQPHLGKWLIALSDPTGLRDAPSKAISAEEWPRVFAEADRHGVLPAVIQNCMKAGCPNASALAEAQGRLIRRTALTLILRGQLSAISAALGTANVPFIVLKGAQFADRLYPDPALRPFTDIDLMVPRLSLDAARDCLRGIDYQPCREPGGKYAGSYGEESWRLPDRPGGTVELHWNMVNSPPLRRKLSVEFEHLADMQGAATPSALLVMAVVHAAASHRFDRLQLLWDIAQSAREAAGPLDHDWLRESTKKTGTAFAMSTALHLTGEALGEARCIELAGKFGFRKRKGFAAPLTVRSVLRSDTVSGRIRRQFYRELLKRL